MELSLQLFSIHGETEKDYKKAVERVAEIGFNGVEFAGCGGLTAEEMADFLKKNKLYSVGAHIGIEQLKEALEDELAYHQAIGSKYLICPYAPTDTLEAIENLAAVLNHAAVKAKEFGIKIGYHNHGEEFNKIDGKYALDLLAEKTSENVILELDVYWAAYAGVDPVTYIRKWGSKIELIHMKQMNEALENVDMAEGCLDMKAIQEAATYASYFVLEHEDYDKPVWESIRNDFKYLSEI